MLRATFSEKKKGNHDTNSYVICILSRNIGAVATSREQNQLFSCCDENLAVTLHCQKKGKSSNYLDFRFISLF